MEMTASLKVFECLRAQLNPYAEEVWILALNSQMQLIGKEMIFRGTVNHCILHPRDIFRYLISMNSTSFILCHNHPSGECKPSEQDLIITQRIFRIAKLMEIQLNDHVILTKDSYFSMADHGMFRSWKRRKNELWI